MLRSTLITVVVMRCLAALAASEVALFRADFSRALKDTPAITLLGNSRLAEGVVRSASLADWRRSGVQVGPIPMPSGHLFVEYDFRAVRFGRQCQEFTSQLPSTHWYMAYADPSGRLHLHTRYQGEWKQRAASEAALKLDTWYRERVILTRSSITILITDKATGNLVWETPQPIAVDDLGNETTFVLCDEAPTADEGSTEWDNLVLSTDDASLAKRFTAHMRALAADRAEQERRQRVAVELRERGIALLPMPQEVRLRQRSYRLPGRPTLCAGRDCSDADVAAVRVALKDRLDRHVRQLVERERADILLRRGNSERPQGYRLEVGEKGVVLQARSPQGFFYAAQTLCQLLGSEGHIPAVAISDAPSIESRLVMIAIDQGAFEVVDVDYWKRIIHELAAAKITHIMPYLEGAGFLYEKYPFLSLKGPDGFTRDKARELSEYAHQRFVELVPQQQSLGHSGAMLYHDELKDLRESGDVFCSSNPRTFAFLSDLYDELVLSFPYSRTLHVGGDEFAGGFAKCLQCKAKAEAIGKPGLYAEHMMRLRDMLRQRRRDMMIWWHEEGFTEEAADKLAKDIIVFDWHYGNQSSYPSLERLQRRGFVHTWATPAVTRYYDAPNDFDNTFGNIQGFLRAAAKAKVPGECTCTWVHGIWGGRNLFELNLYGLLWSAECAWNPVASDAETFRWKFARQWFGLDGKPRLVEEEVLRAVHAPYGSAKEQKFWRDNRNLEPVIAEAPAATAKRIAENPSLPSEAEALLSVCAAARGILERWQKEAKRNRVTADFLLHDVHIHETVARKILAVDALTKAYAGARERPVAERAAALAPAITQLRTVVADLTEIETMFRRSVREAGGGECGWGGWVPFVAKGGILFRAAEGRKGIEELVAQLDALSGKGTWPERVF